MTVATVLVFREGHRGHTRPGHGQQRPHSAVVGTTEQDQAALDKEQTMRTVTQPVTLPAEAVVIGRRVEFAYYRDQATFLPGIITAITGDPASVRVRLDGKRNNVACRPDYDGIRYLDEVVPVPDLPMGAFTPNVADFGGIAYAGIPVCELDDEDIVILTGDPDAARAALVAYCKAQDIDPEYGDEELLHTSWAVFEWQPEDAESSWHVTFDAESVDGAVQIHYLPAA